MAAPQNDIYTCRKCGFKLFAKESVLHEAAQPNPQPLFSTISSFPITSSSSSSSSPSPPAPSPARSATPERSAAVSAVKTSWARNVADSAHCSSVFVCDAPAWATLPAANEGRLSCPKCTARIGSFSWSGAPCSCGRWVTPAFQFQLSRVDARRTVALRQLVAEVDSQRLTLSSQ